MAKKEKQDDPIEAALDEVKRMMRELEDLKCENLTLKLGVLLLGYVPTEPKFSEYETAMAYECAYGFYVIMKKFKEECDRGPVGPQKEKRKEGVS
jgi:hypothetical protein